MGEKKATRAVYGEMLVELAEKYPELVVLDADLSSATMTKSFAKAYPDRFLDMGIAEANMIGVAAGLAADCGDTPVVTDYMIWGGHEVAENAFFLRYGDLDADAHALQVWRTEDHADDEAVYRVGFTLGQDRHYDIAWCGLGHGADPDVLTDVEVWLPAGTFLYDVLYYTTADGEEVRREVYLDKNGTMITLDGEILADSIRLASR